MKSKTILIQICLFVLTVFTTTATGAEWMTGKYFFYPTFGIFQPVDDIHKLHLKDFWQGFQYSIPFLGVLTFHEFGHFFMARYHKIKVTLPYYIPLWFSSLLPNFGTMGAVIRLLEPTKSRKQYFDVGIAGPLAGFVIALIVLAYGFTHLPPPEYIFTIHPEYQQYGLDYAKYVYQDTSKLGGALVLGDSFLFYFFKTYVANKDLVPPIFEIIHYPYILAGYLSLFFTALNLIPVGQLDGGHILYGLIGKKYFNIVSPVLFVLFATYAGYGKFTVHDIANATNTEQTTDLIFKLLVYIYFLQICFSRINPDDKITAWALSLSVVTFQLVLSYFLPIGTQGFSGFLLFVFLLGRVLGVYHPPVEIDKTLDLKRKILGWITLIIFILCFAPQPFMEMP